MAKLEELTNEIIKILRSAGIPAELEISSTYTLDRTPEYVLVRPEKLTVTDTICFDTGTAFKANLSAVFTIMCDKDHVNSTDLDCRVASTIAKTHDVKVNSIYSIIHNTFNEYYVDITVKNLGWVQFDSDDEWEGF